MTVSGTWTRSGYLDTIEVHRHAREILLGIPGIRPGDTGTLEESYALGDTGTAMDTVTARYGRNSKKLQTRNYKCIFFIFYFVFVLFFIYLLDLKSNKADKICQFFQYKKCKKLSLDNWPFLTRNGQLLLYKTDRTDKICQFY